MPLMAVGRVTVSWPLALVLACAILLPAIQTQGARADVARIGVMWLRPVERVAAAQIADIPRALR